MNRILLSFTLLAAFFACQSRANMPAPSPSISSKSDTIKALSNNIMSIYQDSRNAYWFGSWQDGAYRYDGTNLLHFTTKNGLSSNRINEIKEDKAGNIYLNTSGGIHKFDGESFSALPVYEGIGAIWQLSADDLWFKCPSHLGQVYRYDGESLQVLQLPKSELEAKFYALFPNTTISPYDVYCIYKDSKGNVWFGFGALGACRYDGTNLDWLQEEDIIELHYGPSNGVRSIIEDKDGYFWFNSAYRYQVYGGAVELQKQEKNKLRYLRERSIGALDEKKDSDLWEYLSIAKDDKGGLWIATYNAGVWHYDGNKTQQYLLKDGEKEVTTFSVYIDRSGGIWVGTHEAGVYKFNGKDFEKFVI